MTSTQETRQTILLVDDTPENVIVLGAQLKPYYRVRVANSGPRALKVAASAPIPDLILLDIMMPDMDGFAVLEALRRDPMTRKIPVIFVSALNGPEDEEKGLAVGAVDYITKPVRPAMLLHRVQLHLEHERLRRQLEECYTHVKVENTRRLSAEQQLERVTLRALTSLVEIQHPDGFHHLARTSLFLEQLAIAYFEQPWPSDALYASRLTELVLASSIHDIGIVALPPCMTHRYAATHPEHQTLLESHCRLGAQAIERAIAELDQPSELLFMARDIAAYHHERWDGKGYPYGKAGLDIPLGARLTSVADAYDALTSTHPQHPALTHEQAMRQLAQERDSHFDPRIIDALLKVADGLPTLTSIYGGAQRTSPHSVAREAEASTAHPVVARPFDNNQNN